MLLTALFRLLLVEVPNRVNVVQKYLDTAYLAKKPKEAVLELMKTLLMAGFEFSHTLGQKRKFDRQKKSLHIIGGHTTFLNCYS